VGHITRDHTIRFLYAACYLFGAPTDRWLTDVAILPLGLIPFAFGYSVMRYRLMDVELVVRRVFVYALTTLAIALLIGVAVYYGGLYAFGSIRDSRPVRSRCASWLRCSRWRRS
jgi:hypothetical protein